MLWFTRVRIVEMSYWGGAGGWVMAKGAVNLGCCCWGALGVLALEYQRWLELQVQQQMCLITGLQSVSDQGRLTGDAVGLEKANLGHTSGCWMMYTLPVSK